MGFVRDQLVFQCTLKSSFSFEGIGVHGGKPSRVTVRPLPVNSGLWFAVKRGRAIEHFPALSDQSMDSPLSTCLGRAGGRVKTVEHLLSALYGTGIDNALVLVVGDEVPIGDGSSWPFVQGIQKAGVHVYSEPKRVERLETTLMIEEGDRSIRYRPTDGNKLFVRFEVVFRHPLMKSSAFEFVLTPQKYVSEVSRARTFGFLRDAEMLYQRGLALGASQDNTIVLTEDGMLNPPPLRYPDEFVRHKICDALGDLALSGCYLHGTLEFRKSGHVLNRKFADLIYRSRISRGERTHTHGFVETAGKLDWKPNFANA